jgi:hypothetical protein
MSYSKLLLKVPVDGISLIILKADPFRHGNMLEELAEVAIVVDLAKLLIELDYFIDNSQ